MTESNIPNFKWYLPRAFNDAIYKCKFEQGDILYPSHKGYFKWKEAKHQVRQFIQVKSTSGLSEEDSKGLSARAVFQSNWYSSIIFSVYQAENMSHQEVSTTQGHLYNILWKGEHGELAYSTFEPPQFLQSDFGIVDINRPKPKEDKYESKEEYNYALKKYNEWYRGEKKEMRSRLQEYLNQFRRDPVHVFSFGYDSTNPTSIEKMESLKLAFNKKLRYSVKTISIEVLMSQHNYNFAPTQEIAVFTIQSIERKKIDEIFKDVLHSPNKNATTQRFNIERHGILLYN